MFQSTVLLAGRALLAAIFLVAGVRKVMFFTAQAAYFAKLGFPAPEAFVVLGIVIEVGAGVLLVLGLRARAAAWLLALLTVIATLMAHRFWEAEPAQFGNQLNHFLKNLGIIGGLLFVAACGPGRAAFDRK